MEREALGVRWTMGDVSERGLEAPRLSRGEEPVGPRRWLAEDVAAGEGGPA